MFKAFKPSGMAKIARAMGYQGDMENFDKFLGANPAKQMQMNNFVKQAQQMAKGGVVVKLQEGGTTTPTETTEQPTEEQQQPTTNIGDITVQRMTQPGVPTGGKVDAAQIMNPSGAVPTGTELTTGTGQLGAINPIDTAIAGVTQADTVKEKAPQTVEAETSKEDVDTALQATQAAQGTVDPRANVVASQQAKSSVGDLSAAQGAGILMDNPVQREIQDGELITGAADAQKAAKFTEEIQAAQATPSQKATVQGQLDSLMQDFEGGNTPAWAAGAMRKANSMLASRGLGASSIAGQAVIQAAMESAIPIAQADASTVAQFESQNLSNRQQRNMLAAQQRAEFMGMEFDQEFQARVQNAGRIADVANMNFTAEQQVALENSRIANTMNLQNLSNQQALVMAEAAALSQLDMANLSNRQQAAVMNAQNFMQMDMANLSNRQQTEMFKAQSRIQSLFTDQAAVNAANQFNATSQNQTDQFFANLQAQTSQFNASQANAQAQFNAGQINTIERFNQEIANQRDQFNAQNQLVIAQSNAQWRREIATADTASINRANELNAKAVLDISNEAYNNLWQYYGDTMEWAWTSAENNADRIAQMAMAELDAKVRKDLGKLQVDASESGAIGTFVTDMFTSPMTNTLIGGIFN